MKIEIIDVQADSSVVSFSTAFGGAVALWNGALPKPYTVHRVEVEISDTLIWGDSIEQIQENKYSLGIETGEFFLAGRLESAENDGYAVIRIGDYVVTAVALGYPPPLGVFVKLRTMTVILYDENI